MAVVSSEIDARAKGIRSEQITFAPSRAYRSEIARLRLDEGLAIIETCLEDVAP